MSGEGTRTFRTGASRDEEADGGTKMRQSDKRRLFVFSACLLAAFSVYHSTVVGSWDSRSGYPVEPLPRAVAGAAATPAGGGSVRAVEDLPVSFAEELSCGPRHEGLRRSAVWGAAYRCRADGKGVWRWERLGPGQPPWTT